MTARGHGSSPGRQSGFTLIEALIAALVLSIGLLGLAGLQVISLRMSQGAYLRSQAVNLAYEIVDAMRANQTKAATYVGALPEAGSFPTCNAGYVRTNTTNIVADDVNEWLNRVACLFPQGGEAAIELNGNVFTITVCWDETHYEAASADTVCQNATPSLAGTMHFSFNTEL